MLVQILQKIIIIKITLLLEILITTYEVLLQLRFNNMNKAMIVIIVTLIYNDFENKLIDNELLVVF